MLYRQGDVLLKPIKTIPPEAASKNLILVEGEATGHYHQFLDHVNVAVFELSGQQYVQVQQASELIHDEHDTLFIPKGLYEVIIQREVNLLEEIHRVMD